MAYNTHVQSSATRAHESKYHYKVASKEILQRDLLDLNDKDRQVLIHGCWLALAKIGEGSFGEVYEAHDTTNHQRYAIKRERVKMRHPQLEQEAIFYKAVTGGPGIPQCYWYGQHEDYYCMTMDLLGPSLNQLLKTVHTIPLENVTDLTIQMYNLPVPEMYEVHDAHGTSHSAYTKLSCRDILQQWNDAFPRLYIVDFGLAAWWRDPETQIPYPEKKKDVKNKVGTARYASLNVHRYKTHSRRDDLQAIGYLMLELLLGSLPWTGINARSSRNGWERMRQMKEDVYLEDLCAGMPKGILAFVEYTQKLRFSDTPDYALLRTMLLGCQEKGSLYSVPVQSPFEGKVSWKNVEPRVEPTANPIARPSVEQKDLSAAKSSEGIKAAEEHGFQWSAMVEALDNASTKEAAQPLAIKERVAFGETSSTSSTSSTYKLIQRVRQGEKRIGWNTHKREEVPWEPKVDWGKNEIEAAPSAPVWQDDTALTWTEEVPYKPPRKEWSRGKGGNGSRTGAGAGAGAGAGGGSWRRQEKIAKIPQTEWPLEDNSWAKMNGVPW
ncbi:kinase-like domain-containing protein [Spinellus fusiger]|nr:kinase-like domain-containing protein [Spinellus fusiger]